MNGLVKMITCTRSLRSGTFHLGDFVHQVGLEEVAVKGHEARHEVDQVYFVFQTLDQAQLNWTILKC